MNLAAVIPAYKPGAALLEMVRELSRSPLQAIVVVDDGSGPGHRALFDRIRQIERVHTVHHAINLGKGAALKTGLNYAYCEFPNCVGFVTADADGQHRVKDILLVAHKLVEEPPSLVIGARSFSRLVPARSRFGNMLTRSLFALLVGYRLRDTQSGLRGIPRAFIPRLLKINATGYEFELDMLIACKYESRKILELSIDTVYFDDNALSHFNPLRDSMRIYFVLFRFATVSIMTAIIDGVVFLGVYRLGATLAIAQVFSRLVAMIFNYVAIKRNVFYSQERNRLVVPKYVLLVAVLGVMSYGLIDLAMSWLGLGVIAAKILAESLIFILNFATQREFVWSKKERRQTTDWNAYYIRPVPTAKYSRRFTERALVGLMGRFVDKSAGPPRLVELGGADSCFFDAIRAKIAPSTYHVIDNNRYGLERFRQRLGEDASVVIDEGDVLDLHVEIAGDLVFSVGLIEHFDPAGTRRAVDAHFDVAKNGGIVIISFPTPTLLYRVTRGVAELLGVWRFPDERPLHRGEVAAAMTAHGEILYERIIWSVLLTQHIIVARKRPENVYIPESVVRPVS